MEFKHKPLNLERPAIRLLYLNPGSGSVITCKLVQVELDQRDEMISYEALSYVWGSSQPSDSSHHSKIIHVDSFCLSITNNLYWALLDLRSQTIKRCLWIDAICIDQKNDREKGHQVGQMGNIYRQADRVIFRLGLGSKWTDVFMDSLQWLQSESLKHVCKDWPRQDSRWEKLWASYRPPLGECHVDLVKSQCQGLQEILDEPWFRRVWILQEVALAKAAIISCGTKSVSARLFNLTPLLLGATPNAHCQSVLDIMPSQWKESTRWSANQTFYKLLLNFGSSEASEPLDLVYALRGMASDLTGDYSDTLFPNYEKYEDELAQDVIKHIYRNYLHLLQKQPLCSIRELINIIPKLEVDICRSLLEEPFGHWRLETFLQRPEVTTQEMMKAAAQYDKSGKVVQQILRYCGEEYKLEEDVLVYAATNLAGAKQVFETFLGHQNQLIITEKILVATAENSSSGHLVMCLLLSLETLDYKITPVLEAVARNRSEYSRAEIIRILLQQKNNTNNIISELLTAAADIQCYGPCILEHFVREKPDFKIAEYAIIAAMKNWRGGVDCLRVILRCCPSYITITRGIIQAASNSPSKGSTVIALLVQNPAVHAQLSKEERSSAMTPIIDQALVKHFDFDENLSQDSIHEFSARNRKSKLESIVREMGEEQDFFDKDVISSVKLYGVRVVEDLFIFRRKEAMKNDTCVRHFLNEIKAEVRNWCDMDLRYSFQRNDILDAASEQKRVMWSDDTPSKEIEEIRYLKVRDKDREYPLRQRHKGREYLFRQRDKCRKYLFRQRDKCRKYLFRQRDKCRKYLFRQRDKRREYPFQQRDEDQEYPFRQRDENREYLFLQGDEDGNYADKVNASLFKSEEERRYWGPWIHSDKGQLSRKDRRRIWKPLLQQMLSEPMTNAERCTWTPLLREVLNQDMTPDEIHTWMPLMQQILVQAFPKKELRTWKFLLPQFLRRQMTDEDTRNWRPLLTQFINQDMTKEELSTWRSLLPQFLSQKMVNEELNSWKPLLPQILEQEMSNGELSSWGGPLLQFLKEPMLEEELNTWRPLLPQFVKGEIIIKEPHTWKAVLPQFIIGPMTKKELDIWLPVVHKLLAWWWPIKEMTEEELHTWKRLLPPFENCPTGGLQMNYYDKCISDRLSQIAKEKLK